MNCVTRVPQIYTKSIHQAAALKIKWKETRKLPNLALGQAFLSASLLWEAIQWFCFTTMNCCVFPSARKKLSSTLFFRRCECECFNSTYAQTLQPGSRLAFSLEVRDIPKVNCPDYTCTRGVIVWVNMAGRQRPTPSSDSSPPVCYCPTHLLSW